MFNRMLRIVFLGIFLIFLTSTTTVQARSIELIDFIKFTSQKFTQGEGYMLPEDFAAFTESRWSPNHSGPIKGQGQKVATVIPDNFVVYNTPITNEDGKLLEWFVNGQYDGGKIHSIMKIFSPDMRVGYYDQFNIEDYFKHFGVDYQYLYEVDKGISYNQSKDKGIFKVYKLYFQNMSPVYIGYLNYTFNDKNELIFEIYKDSDFNKDW